MKGENFRFFQSMLQKGDIGDLGNDGEFGARGVGEELMSNMSVSSLSSSMTLFDWKGEISD